MFLTQGIYDIDELARFNLHIHTCFSGCAKDEMTFENIVKTAEDAGLEMIALCDHIYKREDLPEFIENCQLLRQKRDELNNFVKKYNNNVYIMIKSDTLGVYWTTWIKVRPIFEEQGYLDLEKDCYCGNGGM